LEYAVRHDTDRVIRSPRPALVGAIALLAAIALAACAREAPARPHILLITVDTLRADHLGCYGSDLDLTPNLDRLARESTRFSAAFTPAPFTLGAVSSMLTGLHPQELGIHSNRDVLIAGVPTLASALSRVGYRSGAVVGNYVLRDASGVAAGFERFDDRFPSAEGVRGAPERTAGDTTDAALEMLDALRLAPRDPVFLWVHYQDPHGPYTPPPGYRERQLARERERAGGTRRLPISPGDRGLGAIPRYQALGGADQVAHYRSGYQGEILYTDEAIGRLLDALDSRGILDRAVVVFAADHGEGLGERDYWFAHGEYLNDGQVRVPLLIRTPRSGAQVRDDVASLQDVVPTLLALAGAEVSGRWRGRDLFAPEAGTTSRSVYLATLDVSTQPRFGVVEGRHKFIAASGPGPSRDELFSLGDESTNLVDREPELAAQLRATLERMRAEMPPKQTRSAPLAEEDRQRLRALGYIHDD
jgi:arylsulfatase